MSRLIIFLLGLALGAPAQAILTRADRDDAEYIEMATKYTSYVALGVPDGGGVLINSRWVLTAAQMAEAVAGKKGHRVRIGTESYAIERVVTPPDWKKGGDGDIALILLERAVRDVEPTPIYRGSDENGKTIVIVGAGHSGKIGEKPQPKEKWDRKARASVNTVDRVSPRTLGLKIKGNDEASDLQGALGAGDRGGPAFVQTPEGLQVIGIGYATEDANGNSVLGDVGDWDLFTRCSAFGDWIEKTMLDLAREEAAKLLGG